MNEQQKIGALEAMLFAHADPVEAARLADALRVEPEEALRLLKKLQRKLDEEESGMAILYFDPDRWQMATRPYYGEMVKRMIEDYQRQATGQQTLDLSVSAARFQQAAPRQYGAEIVQFPFRVHMRPVSGQNPAQKPHHAVCQDAVQLSDGKRLFRPDRSDKRLKNTGQLRRRKIRRLNAGRRFFRQRRFFRHKGDQIFFRPGRRRVLIADARLPRGLQLAFNADVCGVLFFLFRADAFFPHGCDFGKHRIAADPSRLRDAPGVDLDFDL